MRRLAALLLVAVLAALAVASASQARGRHGCPAPVPGPPTVILIQCPNGFAQPGPQLFTFSTDTPGARVEANIDGRVDGNGDPVWRSISSPVTFNGLAPGGHAFVFRAVYGDATGPETSVSFIMPGPVARFPSIGLVNFEGTGFSSTFSSDLPAWRYYCSVNGAPEVVCRPSGITTHGELFGLNTITIRALAGPLDPGRISVVDWIGELGWSSLHIYEPDDWGWVPQ